MKAPCPGKKGFITKTKDLDPKIFRRLVDRRARHLVNPQQPASTNETTRRKLEKELEKVHLQADFLPASFLRDGAAKARAVCRIKTARSLGTGFLIAPGILMTNNHVLGSKNEARDSVAEFGFEPDREMIVVTILPNRLFITHRELDFTIVACDAEPLTQIPHVPLLRSPATVTRHELGQYHSTPQRGVPRKSRCMTIRSYGSKTKYSIIELIPNQDPPVLPCLTTIGT